jgi:hypothetical protein
MFRLSENDLDKITKGIGYLMDNNSPLYLKKGKLQNFLRMEMAETDENGYPVINFSGVEFNLDADVSDEIFLTNGANFIGKLKALNEPSITIIECDDGSVELEVSDNDNFTFNVGLSDPETIFKEYGGNEDFITAHKEHLKYGLTYTLEQKGYDVTELFISNADLDKIKKFNSSNSDSVNFYMDNGQAIVSNSDKNNNDRYKFIFQENVKSDNVAWNIPTNRLTKIHKSDYKMNVYHKNGDVKSVTMKSLDNNLTYILPLV